MTSTPKVPSLRPIPRKHWAIPLPNLKKLSGDEMPELSGSRHMDYGRACQELEGLGFERIYSEESIAHSSLKYAREGDPAPAPDEHALWCHPKGLLAATKSYRGFEEPRPVMDRLDVYYELESGAGSEFAHIAAVKVSSSGSSSIQFDGTNRKRGSANCSSGSRSIISFLESCQKYGRLIPFERWSDREHFIHLPDEMLFPVLDAEKFRGQDLLEEIKASPEMLDEGRARLMAAIPREVRGVVSRAAWEVLEPPPTSPAPANEEKHEMDWMLVEYAHQKVSEALFLSGQRFPSEEVRGRVRHWMEVAAGGHGEDMSGWEVDEPGPAGLSLPTVLLFARSPSSHRRLLKMIKESPEEVVRQWVTQPDASGYVLGQRLISRAFVGSSVEDLAALEAQLVEVYEALIERVGVKGIHLGTSSRSALGVWVEELADLSDYERSTLAFREALASRLLMRMASDGLEWKVPLRWRTYPNVFQSTDKTPRFKEVEGAVPSPPQWAELLGSGGVESALIPALMSMDLDKRLPAAPARRSPGGRF